MDKNLPTPYPYELTFIDHVIMDLVEPKSKVLDLGCGDGRLLHALAIKKEASVQGVELSEEAIYRCVEKGISVTHADIDSGLTEYPDGAFDYVILNQSLPEIKQVDFVLQESLRVAKKVIVAFPNFAHLKARIYLGIYGRAPVTKELPNPWYDTPSLRFLSIQDFFDYCKEHHFKILTKRFCSKDQPVRFLPNLLATHAIFLIAQN